MSAFSVFSDRTKRKKNMQTLSVEQYYENRARRLSHVRYACLVLLVLFVLEVLNEASIRMPKYVGMALSVVGALVLGETAVSAGFVSTPAIIIIAFSGIGLYAVPNLIEVTSVVRLVMLLIAGSVGTYGIILATAFILLYLVTTENFGAPVLAPFSPLVGRDLRDSLIKYNLGSLQTRPKTIGSKNKRRLKQKEEQS